MKFVHGNNVLTANGWETDIVIGIDDAGRIASVEKSSPERVDVATDRLDLILPAITNVHSHAFQRAMSGLTEARGPDPHDSFWTWRNLMYRFLDRLDPDHVEKIARLVYMEMLEAGYSHVAEFHYLHHGPGGGEYSRLSEMSDRIISAAQSTGIGLTLLPVQYQYGGCDKRDLEGGQRRFGSNIDRFAILYHEAEKSISSSLADYNIGVAPHSLRAIDPERLMDFVNIAGSNPIHMHLAEQIGEVEEFSAHFGARPTQWLLNNHDIGSNWCLVHCTQMNDDETNALAQSGAVAGLCPITESSLGDGIFNGKKYVTDGGRLAVGSDSNIHINLFEELKTLEYSQRLRDRGRAVLATNEKSTGRNLFDLAAAGGAQATQRESGAMKAGMWADLIGIDTNNHWLANRTGDFTLDSLIFGGNGQNCITDVWSAGRHVVKDGKHFKNETITRDFVTVLNQIGQEI